MADHSPPQTDEERTHRRLTHAEIAFLLTLSADSAPPNVSPSRLLALALREAQALHDEDKDARAARVLSVAEDVWEGRWGPVAEGEEDVVAEYHSKSHVWEEIRKEAAAVQLIYANTDETVGWELVKTTGDGISVWYRHENHTDIHSLRIDGEVEVDPMHLLACVNEVDLYPTWIPFGVLKDVETIAEPSKYRKILRMEFKIPWPLANRDCVLLGHGIDNLEEGYIIISIKSVNEDDIPGIALDLPFPPDGEGGAVRILMHFAGLLVFPLARDRARLVMLSNIDPMMPFVPKWLLNFINTQVAPMVFSLFTENAKNAENNEYAERMAANPAFYSEISDRINAYFDDQERGGDGELTAEEQDLFFASLGLLDNPQGDTPSRATRAPGLVSPSLSSISCESGQSSRLRRTNVPRKRRGRRRVRRTASGREAASGSRSGGGAGGNKLRVPASGGDRHRERRGGSSSAGSGRRRRVRRVRRSEVKAGRSSRTTGATAATATAAKEEEEEEEESSDDDDDDEAMFHTAEG